MEEKDIVPKSFIELVADHYRAELVAELDEIRMNSELKEKKAEALAKRKIRESLRQVLMEMFAGSSKRYPCSWVLTADLFELLKGWPQPKSYPFVTKEIIRGAIAVVGKLIQIKHNTVLRNKYGVGYRCGVDADIAVETAKSAVRSVGHGYSAVKKAASIAHRAESFDEKTIEFLNSLKDFYKNNLPHIKSLIAWAKNNNALVEDFDQDALAIAKTMLAIRMEDLDSPGPR